MGPVSDPTTQSSLDLSGKSEETPRLGTAHSPASMASHRRSMPLGRLGPPLCHQSSISWGNITREYEGIYHIIAINLIYLYLSMDFNDI